MKVRRSTFDLGTIAAGSPSYSSEMNLASSTRALVHLVRDSNAAVTIGFEAAPEDFSETASWHPIYISNAPSTDPGTIQVLTYTWGADHADACSIQIPSKENPGHSFTTPRRMRLSFTSTADITVKVETYRSIA